MQISLLAYLRIWIKTYLPWVLLKYYINDRFLSEYIHYKDTERIALGVCYNWWSQIKLWKTQAPAYHSNGCWPQTYVIYRRCLPAACFFVSLLVVAVSSHFKKLHLSPPTEFGRKVIDGRLCPAIITLYPQPTKVNNIAIKCTKKKKKKKKKKTRWETAHVHVITWFIQNIRIRLLYVYCISS